MAVTRQQRRQRARELAGLGQSMVRRGVPRAPRFADLLGLTLAFRQALEGKGPPSPGIACAEIAHKTYEASMRADPATAPVTCRKGCAYCCYGTVMVTAPEAFRLAHEVAKARPGRPESDRAAFLARAAATANLTAAERFGRKLPCPLLADELCSVYAARPLSCRRVTSFAVEPCREEYEGQPGDILMPKKALTHAGNTQIPLLAALKAIGRPVRLYELAAAVRSVLETEGAEAKWLAGEDIFSGVSACEEPGPELAGVIGRLAAEVRSIEGS